MRDRRVREDPNLVLPVPLWPGMLKLEIHKFHQAQVLPVEGQRSKGGIECALLRLWLVRKAEEEKRHINAPLFADRDRPADGRLLGDELAKNGGAAQALHHLP